MLLIAATSAIWPDLISPAEMWRSPVLFGPEAPVAVAAGVATTLAISECLKLANDKAGLAVTIDPIARKPRIEKILRVYIFD